MEKGLLITNGFLHSDSFAALYRALCDAAAAHGRELVHVANSGLMPLIDRADGMPGSAIFWDKDVRLGYALEGCGMRLYNSARAIELCDDKALTHLALRGTVPMPKTLLVPFSFPGVGYPDFAFLDKASDILGYPMVIKECFGSFGMQVYLANTPDEARAILSRISGVPAIMQEFVSESAGRDVRIYVVGGRAIASILRENPDGGFIANVARGGRATAHTPSPDEERIAIAAAAELKLDFCGVDLLLGKDSPLLIEVNSNAHFAGISAATGVNVADSIVSHFFSDF